MQHDKLRISDHDRRWMQHALELAQRGIGLCSPNPVVGCVILDTDGNLCGEGWHEYDLRDHAEVAALRAAGEKARGGTAYVTLEPCNHTGRTGPCSQALLDAGIARVLAATIDPNTKVSGGGIQALHQAGVETSVGLCEPDARRLNESFARWSQSHRPFVHMKVAMSLDGRIAPPASQRTAHAPFWITGQPARDAVHRLRWQADAVITGIDTVIADNPLLTDRSGLRRRRPLLRVILDSKLRLPLNCKVVESAQNDVLLFTTLNDPARIRELACNGVRVEVVPAESGRVPLSHVLDTLGQEGILTLLTECGSRLNSALLASQLVDRIQVFVAPRIMGASAFPAFSAGPMRLSAWQSEPCGDDLSITSLLRDPWQPTS